MKKTVTYVRKQCRVNVLVNVPIDVSVSVLVNVLKMYAYLCQKSMPGKCAF